MRRRNYIKIDREKVRDIIIINKNVTKIYDK